MGERGLWAAIGDAIADMRSKIIDEGWFGRSVGERSGTGLGWDSPTGHATPPILPQSASFEDAWAVREPHPEQATHAHDTGLDR